MADYKTGSTPAMTLPLPLTASLTPTYKLGCPSPEKFPFFLREIKRLGHECTCMGRQPVCIPTKQDLDQGKGDWTERSATLPLRAAGDAYHTVGHFQSERENLYSRIQAAWASALKIAFEEADGLVHVPASVTFHLRMIRGRWIDTSIA